MGPIFPAWPVSPVGPFSPETPGREGEKKQNYPEEVRRILQFVKYVWSWIGLLKIFLISMN